MKLFFCVCVSGGAVLATNNQQQVAFIKLCPPAFLGSDKSILFTSGKSQVVLLFLSSFIWSSSLANKTLAYLESGIRGNFKEETSLWKGGKKTAFNDQKINYLGVDGEWKLNEKALKQLNEWKPNKQCLLWTESRAHVIKMDAVQQNQFEGGLFKNSKVFLLAFLSDCCLGNPSQKYAFKVSKTLVCFTTVLVKFTKSFSHPIQFPPTYQQGSP